MATLMCPNNHPVEVPDHPTRANVSGLSYVTASASDLIQDCPLCGQFEHHPDGRAVRELQIAGADIVANIVANRRAIMIALADAGEVTIEAVATMTGLDVDQITTALADVRVFDTTHAVTPPTVIHAVRLKPYGTTLAQIAITEPPLAALT